MHPTMIPKRHLLAGVGGAFNAIYIHGEALGSTMYFGLGAGEMPTATAVMADILEIARASTAAGAGARRMRSAIRSASMQARACQADGRRGMRVLPALHGAR